MVESKTSEEQYDRAGAQASIPVFEGYIGRAPASFVAHIATKGDVRSGADGWAGWRNSGLAVEGFEARLDSDAGAQNGLSYQGVMVDGTLTEVVSEGGYCGTRGKGLPLLGFRIVSDHGLAGAFDLTYEARFLDGTQVGPLASPEICRAPSNAPLEAFRVAYRAGATVAPSAGKPPRTLVFCTAYSHAREYWDARYGLWLKALLASTLYFDTILMVDDGSDSLPDWPGLAVWTDQDALPVGDRLPKVILYHFGQRLGRRSIRDFPGWYRSFTFAGKFAAAYGFEKVIHIESDCFLISERVQGYVNGLTAGWTTMWCPHHDMPESAIQIIAGDALTRFTNFESLVSQESLHDRLLEHALPVDVIEKAFKGDRYGEYLAEVPRDADYTAQVHADRQADYLWWLRFSDWSRVPVLQQVNVR